eukprot:365157-Chlamydomonas_euryale.AAC.14
MTGKPFVGPLPVTETLTLTAVAHGFASAGDGQQQQQNQPARAQHPAAESVRSSASEAKDAHLPPSGGTTSARSGKKRGPRMVSRRPVTTHGKVTKRCY